MCTAMVEFLTVLRGGAGVPNVGFQDWDKSLDSCAAAYGPVAQRFIPRKPFSAAVRVRRPTVLRPEQEQRLLYL